MYQLLWKRPICATTWTTMCLITAMLVGSSVLGADVEVAKGRHSFGVSGFGGDAAIAGQVTDVLKNDIRLSGYFLVAPVSSAEFVQSGSVRGGGSSVTIDCVVMQQATKAVVLSKSYQGSVQDLRRVVHKISDDIDRKSTRLNSSH